MNNTSYTGAPPNTQQKSSSSSARFDGVPHALLMAATGTATIPGTPTLLIKKELLSHKGMIEQIQAEQRAALGEVGIFAGKPALSARLGDAPSKRWGSVHQSALNHQRETERAHQIGQRLTAEKDAREQRRFTTQAAEFVSGVVDGMISVVSPQGAAAEAVDFGGAAEEASATPLSDLLTLQRRTEALGFSMQLVGVDDPANATLANMTVFFVETPGANTFAKVCKLHEVVTEFLEASTQLVGAAFECETQGVCQMESPSFNANFFDEYRCEDIDPMPVQLGFPFKPFSPDFTGAFVRLGRFTPPVEGNSTFVMWQKEYMDRWQPDGDFPYAVVSKNMTAPASPQPAPAPTQPDVPQITLPPEMAPVPAPSHQEIAPAPSQPEMPPAAFQPAPSAQPSMPPVDLQPEISPADLEPEVVPADLEPGPGTSPVPPQSGGLSLAAMWGIASGASVATFLLATQAYRLLRSRLAPTNPSQTTVTMSPLGPYANQAGASSNLPLQASAATPPLTSVQVDSSSDTSSVVGSASSDSTSDVSGISIDDVSEVLGAGHSSGE